MPLDLAAIGLAAAKSVASALAGRLAGAVLPQEKVSRWLGRDPQRLALRSAMRDALAVVEKNHRAVSEGFFDEVFLTTTEVATLLARCVPPGAAPAPAELAALYVAHLGPTPNRSAALKRATPVAEDFLTTFREHLRHRDAFRLFFDSADAGATQELLAALLEQLPDLLARLDHAPERLRSHIKSMTTIRDQHTEFFVGREFVMNELDDRLAGMSRGYVLLTGQPGIGKSAVMAELVRTRDYVHHFNVAAGGIRTADQFLRNVCAQLILRYDLPYGEVPSTAGLDSAFLDEALHAALRRPGTERPVVLLVDALDEAEEPAGEERRASVNRLKLPPSLPDGVVVVASIREGVDSYLAASPIELRADDERNRDDVLRYTRAFFARHPEMDKRLTEWKLTADAMTQQVADRCGGNFMYLVYLLEGIAGGTVTRTTHGDLTGLPSELTAYYKRHWRAMRDLDDAWFERVQRPVVCMMAVAPGPVTVPKIAEWINHGGLPPVQVREVKKVIREWRPFLTELPGDPPRWRIYHKSFLEFLADHPDIDLNEFREAGLAAMDRKIRWDA